MANPRREPPRQWDECSVFAALAEASGADGAAVARHLLDFAVGLDAKPEWNRGPRATVRIRMPLNRVGVSVMSIYTYAGHTRAFAGINIAYFHDKVSPALLSSFITSLRKSPCLAGKLSNFESGSYERHPSLPLDYLAAHPEEIAVVEDALRLLIERG